MRNEKYNTFEFIPGTTIDCNGIGVMHNDGSYTRLVDCLGHIPFLENSKLDVNANTVTVKVSIRKYDKPIAEITKDNEMILRIGKIEIGGVK